MAPIWGAGKSLFEARLAETVPSVPESPCIEGEIRPGKDVLLQVIGPSGRHALIDAELCEGFRHDSAVTKFGKYEFAVADEERTRGVA